MNSNKLWRLASTLFIMAILAVTMMVAVPRGVADFYYFPADRNLERWQRHAEQTADKLVQTEAFLKAAMQWDSTNPDIRVARGRYFERSVEDRYFWQVVDQTAYRQALEEFKQVARMRPSSPWAWINIALMKTRLNEFDALLQNSLDQAAGLGPWEPLVNTRITDIALTGWSELPDSTRELIVKAVNRGLQQDRKGIVEVVQRHQRMDWLCGHIRDRQTRHEICHMAEPARSV